MDPMTLFIYTFVIVAVIVIVAVVWLIIPKKDK